MACGFGAADPSAWAQQQAGGAPVPAVRAPEDVLADQLAAFNAADVEAMAANVSEAFAWIAVDSDGAAVQLAGREQFRRSMQAYFSGTPGARAEIVGVLANGNFISAVERAYWVEGGVEQYQDALAVYEVRGGLIHRVWYFPVLAPPSESPGG